MRESVRFILKNEKSQVAWLSLGQATFKMKSCEGQGYHRTHRAEHGRYTEKHPEMWCVLECAVLAHIQPHGGCEQRSVLTRTSGRPQRWGGEKHLTFGFPAVEYYLQLPLPVHCTDQVIKRPSQTTTKEQLSTSYVLNLLSAKDMRNWGWVLSAKFRELSCHVQPDNMTLWVANLISIKSSQKKNQWVLQPHVIPNM